MLFGSTDVYTTTTGHTSVIAEPSVTNVGSAVIETGNWFAAVSTDGGNSFGFVDPFTTFPPPTGRPGVTFCCDQVVLYSPWMNLTFWSVLHQRDSGGNVIRLAVARGEAALTGPELDLYYYTFAPQNLGFPIGYFYSHPDLALSNGYLYVSTNVFEPDPVGENHVFRATVVLRLPLSALYSRTSFEYAYYTLEPSYFNATMVQQATHTMYWATHHDTGTIRLYAWPENENVSATNITHTPYPTPDYDPITTNYTCPINGAQDWCGRLDDRVLTGWVSNGLIGFMWNAPKGTVASQTYNYPYVQTVLINQSTLALAGESLMQNQNYAFAYPGAGTNAWGHVAGTVFYGGGTTNPTVAAFIWDDLSLPAYPTPPNPWELHDLAASTQGPLGSDCPPTTPRCWGDYLSARQDHTSIYSRFLWVATGFTLQGGGTNSYIHPYFFRFGRERDDPATVQANSKNYYLPVVAR